MVQCKFCDGRGFHGNLCTGKEEAGAAPEAAIVDDVTPDVAARFIIRKDEWVPSRPWFCDVEMSDGHIWKGWVEFSRTRKAVIAHIKSVRPDAEIVFA